MVEESSSGGLFAHMNVLCTSPTCREFAEQVAEPADWSARCPETGTPGAGSGPGKRAGRKAGTAPRADFTVLLDLAESLTLRPGGSSSFECPVVA